VQRKRVVKSSAPRSICSLVSWNKEFDKRGAQVPVATIQAEGGVAWNRVSWAPTGSHLTAGDDSGKIWVYELAEVPTLSLSLSLSLSFHPIP
jgi:hypothetical protein